MGTQRQQQPSDALVCAMRNADGSRRFQPVPAASRHHRSVTAGSARGGIVSLVKMKNNNNNPDNNKQHQENLKETNMSSCEKKENKDENAHSSIPRRSPSRCADQTTSAGWRLSECGSGMREIMANHFLRSPR